MRKWLVVLLGLLFLIYGLVWAYPKPVGYVNDFANIIPDADEKALAQRLHEIKQEVGVQIVIVTTPSLEGLDAETYAREIGNQWGIGQKGKDDGLVLLIAPVEKKWFFKTGYGTEAMLPDSRLGSIGRNTFVPLYRSGKITKAFSSSIEEMYNDIKRYQSKQTTDTAVPTKETHLLLAICVFGILLTIIVCVAIVMVRRDRRKKAEWRAKVLSTPPMSTVFIPTAVAASGTITTPTRVIKKKAVKKSDDDDDDHYHRPVYSEPSRHESRHDDGGSSGGGTDWGGGGGGSFGGGGAGGDL